MHHGSGGRGRGGYAGERNQTEPRVPRNRLVDNERPRAARDADDDYVTIDRDTIPGGLRRPSLEPAGLVRAEATGAPTAQAAAAGSEYHSYNSREEYKQQGMTPSRGDHIMASVAQTSAAYAPDPWGMNFIEPIPFENISAEATLPISGLPLNIDSTLPLIDLSTGGEMTSLLPDVPPNISSSRHSIATDIFSWQNKDAADISMQLDQHIAAMRAATAAATVENQGKTNQFPDLGVGGTSSTRMPSSSSSPDVAMPPSSSFATAAATSSEEDANAPKRRGRDQLSSSVAPTAAATNTTSTKSISQECGTSSMRGSSSTNEENPSDILDQLGITEPIYMYGGSREIHQDNRSMDRRTDTGTTEMNDETPPPDRQPKHQASSTETKKKSTNGSEFSPGVLSSPCPLAMPTDNQWLTPLHCFVREKIVEVFTATQKDVDAPSRGKRRIISLNQVGIRCLHCSPHEAGTYGAYRQGSVYYPLQISAMYNATMNLLQRHFDFCDMVPKEIQETYKTLKSDEARSGMSKKYWIVSAKSFGLVDKNDAIWYTRPAPLQQAPLSGASAKLSSGDPQSTTTVDSAARLYFSTPTTTHTVDQTITQPEVLVYPEDQDKTTSFTFYLLSQIQPCRFTEADRIGKRKGLAIGFVGLACRHCYPQFGTGRFFPSSLKTLSDTSKTLNVLNTHLLKCRSCPEEIREELKRKKELHASERSNLPFGSQKALFTKIWRERLHPPVTPPPKHEEEPSSSQSSSKEKDSSSSSSLKKAASSSSLKKRGRSESDASSDDDHLGVPTPMPRPDDSEYPEPRIKQSRAA